MFAAIVGQSWATAAHPFSLEVNGIDVIASVPMESIRIEMAGPGSNGSCTFTIRDPSAALAVTAWDEVRFIEHAATRPLLFGGFVQSVRYVAWATAGRDIEVQCVGYGILLDKKVMLEAYVGLSAGVYTSRHLVALVNRYGGRVSALCAGDAAAGGPWYTDATYSVSDPSDDYVPSGYAWFSGNPTSATLFNLAAGQTLRSAIDAMSGQTMWTSIPDDITQAAPFTYWVDAAARLCAYPEMPPTAVLATHTAAQYEGGTVPGLTVDVSSPTYRVTALTLEQEDTDRATAAYVVGADATGSGAWYGTGLERAGDLLTLVSDTTSETAEDVSSRAAAAVRRTEGATVRAGVTIEAAAPVDAWPGRNLRLTSAQLGASGDDYRITACRIAFLGGAARTYDIDFGGSKDAPTLSRRTGRYATI